MPRRAYTLPLMRPPIMASMTRAVFPQQPGEYGNGPPLLSEARRGECAKQINYFLYFSIIQGGSIIGTMPLYVTSGDSGVIFHL